MESFVYPEDMGALRSVARASGQIESSGTRSPIWESLQLQGWLQSTCRLELAGISIPCSAIESWNRFRDWLPEIFQVKNQVYYNLPFFLVLLEWNGLFT
ncbi:MAG: hypothetical protein N0E55_06115 [Candidatus Thiodiazotropha taylori]|nr:hypothetical protein [Candidatus Thiodiazotropha taylori]MCG8106161.1 hypothetical protein [Candidatus Thiodiazotropha taylori]MCG8110968.1 hypothetical protein [Candidatus Thiodiazotropha taylori]MCG8123528.1 hypothetical protein [Candidatus Thiodiazotropha taylori]MCW4252264.1 hypothetical protein [Candidatus Thiodiazotropha taylori]